MNHKAEDFNWLLPAIIGGHCLIYAIGWWLS